jgi:hypothetical protein
MISGGRSVNLRDAVASAPCATRSRRGRRTEDTVKGRVRNILSKLDANDRTHAVMIARKRGIIRFLDLARPDAEFRVC